MPAIDKRCLIVFWLTFFGAQAWGFSGEKVSLLPEVVEFLSGGMEVPLHLESKEDSGEHDYEPQGSVVVSIVNGGVTLSKFKIDQDYESTLSPKIMSQLRGDINLTPGLIEDIGTASHVKFDLDEMIVFLSVAPDDMGISDSPRRIAAPSTQSEGVSGVSNYNVNAYFSGEKPSNLSDYNFSSSLSHILSYQETHITTDNFISVKPDGIEYKVDNLVLSRDYNGIRVDVGMDTQAPQRVGTISNFSSERLYYASVTNAADSHLKAEASSSLIPLIVSMPSNGEIRVYKESRLIFLSSLTIGRHQIDTSSFPSGVYEVLVETVIAGSVRESKKFRVNKPSNGRGGSQWVWQLWAGEAKYEKSNPNHSADSFESEAGSAPVGGVNIASSFGEVSWDLNMYRAPESWVVEAGAGLQATSWLSFDAQWMRGSDGASRRFYQASFTPDLGVNVVLTSERAEEDNTGAGEYGAGNSYSSDQAQLSIPLPFLGLGGLLSASYEIDSVNDSHSWGVDYTQNLIENDTFSLSLDTGMDRTSADSAGGIDTNYYVSLNAALYMGLGVDVGVSERNGMKTASVLAGVGLDGFFNYMEIDAQGELVDGNVDSPSLGIRGNYENAYVNGSSSLAISQQNTTISNTLSGSLAFNRDSIATGKASADAGFMVMMPDNLQQGDVEVLVDDSPLPLHAGWNFISASAYGGHEIAFQSSSDSLSSYDILLEEDKVHTLYPGNVSTIQPVIKRMVTVFGRLIDDSGKAIANATVRNHIGESVTDELGSFSIDVDASIPEIEVSSNETGTFKVAMQLDGGHGGGGVVTLRDVVWSPKNIGVTYIISPVF